MSTIVLVIHLMVAVALISVVLLQRSEGGALGIGGGGGGGGGFMSGRGTANMLTRMTTILAGVFFLTSIALTVLSNRSDSGGGGGILEKIDRGAPTSSSTEKSTGGGILDKIQPPTTPVVPASE
jgi:preprotein translocase subunit SecG